nr:hypothetical protein [Tanacetum cinerariifolium]
QWLLGVSGGSRGEWCRVVREAGKYRTRVFRGWREKLCIARYFECRGDMGDGKSASTPIDTKKPLLKDPDGEDVDVHTYRSISDFIKTRHHQIVVATSSTEAEYVAAASCCAQLIQTSMRLLERMLHVPHILSAGYITTPQMVLNSPCLIHIKNLVQIKWSQSWLVQKQTSIGKDESNPFIVDSLLKTICLVRNVDSSSKFYMYLRFLQLKIRAQVGDLSSHTTKYSSPALTQKVFSNMRRVKKGFSKVETPLFEGMLVPQQAVADVDDVVADDDDANDVLAADVEPTPPSPPPTTVRI